MTSTFDHRPPVHPKHRQTQKTGAGRRARVSDHAVLRYMERAYGIDVEGFRTELGVIVLDIMTSEQDVTLIHEGNRYVIREGQLVTVLPK